MPVATFQQNYIMLLLACFVSVNCPVSGAKNVLNFL